MYINAQPPPVLTVAVPAEISVHREMESHPLRLQQYQIIRATVAEAGMDRVVLHLKDHRLTAETDVPLKSGQNLNLQVVSVHPQIRFKIVEDTGMRYLFRALHSLCENTKLLPLLEQLQNRQAQGFEPFSEKMHQLFEALRLLIQGNSGHLTGRSLAGLWNRLGLDLEALLADGKKAEAKALLKSALLIHLKDCQASGHLSENTGKVLEQFKLFQLCRYRLAQENILFVPLPFDFLEQGYLLAEKRNRSDTDPDDREPLWKMTLNLKLSVLGHLQIFLLFEKTELRLRILCDSDDKVEIISRSIKGLKERLTTVSMISFCVSTGAEDPSRYLVRRLAADNKHFLQAEV